MHLGDFVRQVGVSPSKSETKPDEVPNWAELSWVSVRLKITKQNDWSTNESNECRDGVKQL